ncbi:hypothetical protein O9992_24255 [Vibrio lentus]|nr:hypothetical protein [Vibrio lentus]
MAKVSSLTHFRHVNGPVGGTCNTLCTVVTPTIVKVLALDGGKAVTRWPSMRHHFEEGGFWSYTAYSGETRLMEKKQS